MASKNNTSTLVMRRYSHRSAPATSQPSSNCFDSIHPFRVHAAGGVAEDIGTRFVVRAYAREPALRVIVAEGRVSVTRSGGAPVALGAGQLASFDAAGAASVRPVDTAAYVAFSDGRLVFAGTPLDEVVSELGHWYDLDIRLAAPGFAGHHISASFTGLAEDDVLGAVAAAAGLRYTRQGRTVGLSRDANVSEMKRRVRHEIRQEP
jgi:transmembrane sensor